MVRTKKADPVEVTHNVESCVCSDCKTRKLELEVIDLQARYADERAHYDARLKDVKDSMLLAMTRMEARINEDWRTEHVSLSKRFDREAGIATPSRESLSRRIKLLDERVTALENDRSSKVVEDNTFETKVTQRLRDLEACKPIEIRDRDVAHISRDLNLVRERLDRIANRLNPPV